jgi:hypothetical protein
MRIILLSLLFVISASVCFTGCSTSTIKVHPAAAVSVKLDRDRDGLCDADELIAGTNPANSNSTFRLTGATSVVTNGYVITWYSVSNRYYNVCSKSDLMDPAWITNAVRIPGINGTMSYTNTSGTQNVSFYRITVER